MTDGDCVEVAESGHYSLAIEYGFRVFLGEDGHPKVAGEIVDYSDIVTEWSNGRGHDVDASAVVESSGRQVISRPDDGLSVGDGWLFLECEVLE
jgi:hypothetical protein